MSLTTVFAFDLEAMALMFLARLFLDFLTDLLGLSSHKFMVVELPLPHSHPYPAQEELLPSVTNQNLCP